MDKNWRNFCGMFAQLNVFVVYFYHIYPKEEEYGFRKST